MKLSSIFGYPSVDSIQKTKRVFDLLLWIDCGFRALTSGSIVVTGIVVRVVECRFDIQQLVDP